MQMKYQLARLNEMAKRGLEMLRETHRQLEQLCRQLLSAMTARVEESTHAQSPGCDEGISEVHVGPDDPIMIEVDPITANEALGSSIVSDTVMTTTMMGLWLFNCFQSGCGCVDKPGWLWPLRMAKHVSARATRGGEGRNTGRNIAFVWGTWNGPQVGVDEAGSFS